MELTKELIEEAKKHLSNEGYGIGTNFTVNSVANLMAEFAAKLNSNESNEFRTVGNNEQDENKITAHRCECQEPDKVDVMLCRKCDGYLE